MDENVYILIWGNLYLRVKLAVGHIRSDNEFSLDKQYSEQMVV